MQKRALGLIPLLLLAAAASGGPGGPDQSKKAYELIYEDVQALKQQMLRLEAKVDKAAQDVLLLKDQLKEIQAQMKLGQTDQAGLKEDIKSVPTQYQAVLDKLEQLDLAIKRFSEDFVAFRTQMTQPPIEAAGKTAAKEAKPKKKEEPPPASKEGQPQGQPVPAAINPNLSPKEVFDMAYADYTKGNYDLAIEGFKIYRQQFFDSPLADDALYWIGECDFSLKKYGDAIEQFNLLIFNYPQGNNVPGAYLKKGMCFMELGKKEEALSVFKLLISKYPNEEETKIAQQKIKELTGDARY
jgi:tol-pal system protein YbgF